jgi:hypothetical protein
MGYSVCHSVRVHEKTRGSWDGFMLSATIFVVLPAVFMLFFTGHEILAGTLTIVVVALWTRFFLRGRRASAPGHRDAPGSNFGLVYGPSRSRRGQRFD